MAGVNKSDIPVEAAFMTDFWKAIKQFWIAEDNPVYWEEMAKSMKELAEKYPTEFCRGQILAYTKYLNEQDLKNYHEYIQGGNYKNG